MLNHQYQYPYEGAHFLHQLATYAPLMAPSVNTAWLGAVSAEHWLALASMIQAVLPGA